MKNLFTIAVAYVIMGTAVSLGMSTGTYIWKNKIEPKLNK